MKRYKRITLGIFLVQLILILTVVFFFQVDNMILGQGEVSSFDIGWTLSYPDGKVVQIDSLPYHSTCKAGDVLVMENRIPEQYYGETMFSSQRTKNL